MKKALQLAALSSVLALFITPAFADPTGTDPPPTGGNTNAAMSAVILSVLTSYAG
jgi:hypothetical protein